MTADQRPAALGHRCINQATPGAPTCDRPAFADVVEGAVVRPYCGAHVPPSPTFAALAAARAAHDDAERRHWQAERNAATRSELAAHARECDAAESAVHDAAAA